LPLAVAFGEKYAVVGYDISEKRVKELNEGVDSTGELAAEELGAVQGVVFTCDAELLRDCNVYIITVPTPLTAEKEPDLSYLFAASETVGRCLAKGDLVIYESTVYPGCTEEDCVPVLERVSGLKYNQDFFCGYSPERINPGDKVHTVTRIRKIVSGSDPAAAEAVQQLYDSIITAGTYLAPSIRVAEAAKAIENAQRDVNISFMNELALIFDRMGIDTGEVLEAAATKWNFLPFRPGLVGGHCIGVDPHYLAWKAMQLGYEPQVILSGRKVNEQMGVFVAEKMVALLAAKHQGRIHGLRVLVLGFAFKENCADTRNTKVVDIVRTLEGAGLEVSVYDPLVRSREVAEEYGISLVTDSNGDFAGVVLAVAHEVFRGMDFSGYKEKGVVVFDAKGVLERDWVDGRL
jgi:UDP-N-acetyl-D-galactosamine dehydrogenase